MNGFQIPWGSQFGWRRRCTVPPRYARPLPLFEALGSRLRQLDTRLQEVAYSPASVRLARFVLANADPEGRLTGLSHAEMADTIGALRQTVTAILNHWRDAGLVKIGRKTLHVRNRTAWGGRCGRYWNRLGPSGLEADGRF